MTNPQELLTLWTILKAHLLACQPFLSNKALIIEALEFHRNQASSFTSENSHEPLLNQRELAKQKESLTQHLATVADEQEQEKLKKELIQLDQALTNHHSIRQAFTIQKAKNEQIVKDCQELLAKLRE